MSQPTVASNGLREAMRKHPLFCFFLIAYASSWVALIPGILSVWGFLRFDYTISSILSSFAGPPVAAVIMTYITEGKAGVNGLQRRLRQRGAGKPWYLFILPCIPSLLLLGIIVQPGMLASFQGLTPTLLVTYPAYFFVVFFGVALPEEIGWRGFALPRMQPRYGPLWGTLLLGVLWSFWHLPRFLAPDQGGGPGTGIATFLTNFSVFFLLLLALAIIFTWVFNYTGGSVFISNLLHASIDTPAAVWIPLFAAVNVTSIDLANLIAFGVPALLILILTRGRLGYRPVIMAAPRKAEVVLQP
ncbi:MAG: CPBP family intramembrane metalloprotease [Thaumarchaeota archaeon]|nr:CPBP family intramembrane metalloprotease [Nitrososphaerota archaeon]